ncbi:putative hemoglobin and hemoglobin-haptoglobin-binding protein 2 precursor, partial [Haemophilus influenzae]
SVVGNAYTW